MAATDHFEQMLRSLSEQERQALSALISMTKEDLSAARSEEARIRIVEAFNRSVHEEAPGPGR
jgi:hypothetical protein